MGPLDLLSEAVEILERLGIPYLVTGSMATISYGTPRLTLDIDLVVKLNREKPVELCEAFPGPDFYVSLDAALDAVRRKSMFNVIKSPAGLKLDFIVSADTEYDRIRFERGVRLSPRDDIEATYCSPEDIIIKKLQFFEEGESDKHTIDIGGVLKRRGDQLDWPYLAKWIHHFGLQEVWQGVLSQSNFTPPE